MGPQKKFQTKNPAGACPSWGYLSISWAPLYPTASGVSTVRSRASGLGLSRKPDTSGGTSSSRVIMIAPENFRFFGRITNPNSICKGLRDTNHMERLAKGRIVASDLLSMHVSFHPIFLPACPFPCPEVVGTHGFSVSSGSPLPISANLGALGLPAR